MSKDYYIQLRDKYHPDALKLIFLLESPPVSGKYFYDDQGKTTEPLFSAIMKLLRYKPSNKRDGLHFFKTKGYILVDVTYKQVNKLKGKERDETILSDYDELIVDLENICTAKDTPILIVKANVCKLYNEKLKSEGYNVINKGTIIPFPSHGQQNRFNSVASKVLFNFIE